MSFPDAPAHLAVAEQRRRWTEAAAGLVDAVRPGTTLDHATGQVARLARAAAGADAAAVVRVPSTGDPEVAAHDGPRAALDGWGLEPSTPDSRVVVARLRAHLVPACVLVLVLPEGRDRDEERALLSSYADQAGLALDRVVATRERERLAELHDVVVQRLFAAGLQLQTLRDSPPDLLDDGVDQAVEALDAVIREMRGTVLELSPRRGAWPR